MEAGTYLVRRAGVGASAAAVVLSADGGLVDVLTFGGMRSLVLRSRVEELWIPVSTRPKVEREIPLVHGLAPSVLRLRSDGSPERVELWPWNRAEEVIANLARCGLRLSELASAKSINGDQLLVFAVSGSFREPIGHSDFPPFSPRR